MAFLEVFQSFMLLLTLHHEVTSWGFQYSELEHLGGSCFPQDSCAQSRTEEEDHLWNNFTCECGSHCIQYGTCCADSSSVGLVYYSESRNEKCRKLPGMSNSVIVVSQCSYRWRCGNQIRNMCENPKTEMDPIATTPVTNLETQVTYKNYFCALCNYDARDIYFWNIELNPKNAESFEGLSNVEEDYMLQNLVYSDDDKSWGVMDNDFFYPLRLKIALPAHLLKYVKKCYPDMVSQCDPSFGHPYELQDKCFSYYAPINLGTNSSSTKYRNIHCALCNNANVSENDTNLCKLEHDVGGRRKKPPFSLALLLDINRSDGDLVGRVQYCEDKEMWDPFFKKCRSLVCVLPGQVVKDGKCVQN